MTVTAQPGQAAGRPRDQWDELPRRRPVRRSRLLGVRESLPKPWRIAFICASVLLPLAVWTALSASGAVSDTFLPSPLAVWQALVEQASSGQLWSDVSATVTRVAIGFGLAVLVSVPLGIAMGTFPAAEALLEPLIGLLRYLPASAFIPLLIIWLGIGESSKIAVIFIGVVFFNTLMTADAVRLVPRDLVDVSFTLGARRGEVVRKVVIPHALPGIIDAMRVNAAAAWNFVVIAELIAATSGLGFRIARAQRFLDSDTIFAVLVVIALFGVAIDVVLRLVRNRVGRWIP